MRLALRKAQPRGTLREAPLGGSNLAGTRGVAAEEAETSERR